MIEVRSFDGSPEQLAEFVNRVWRQSYEGRMLVPLWDAQFLRRDLLLDDDAPREWIIAAYDGAKLVGVHPARPITIRLHGQEIPASWGSFLSVDPEYRRQKIARQMREMSVRRHRERGAMVNFGYLYYRSLRSLGPKFWLKHPEGTTIVRRAGMWVRALDHAASARFELNKLEAWGSRLFSLFQGPPKPPDDAAGIRRYHPNDLAACRALVCQAGETADLAYVWDPASLSRQLQFGNVSDTVVLDRDGRPAGLVNYTLLEILGRCPMTVALIDLVAWNRLEKTDRRRLLAAALCRLVEVGAKAVMMLRGSWYGWRELLGAGFFPVPPEYYFVGTRARDDFQIRGVRRMHVLWR